MVELDRRDMEQYANNHTTDNRRKKRSAWATFASWDKLLLVFVLVSLFSALAALFVFLTPMLDFVLNFTGLHYAGWVEWHSWIMDGDRGLAIVAALVLIALLFALLARFRVRRNWSVYAEAGCPQCHEHELIRVQRLRRDRALSFMGVPVRRYSCRNCTWHGVRLAGYRYAMTADKIEEPEVDELEIDDGIVGTIMESIDEGSSSAETVMAPAIAAEMMVPDASGEAAPEMDSLELAEQPVAAQPSEFMKAPVFGDAAHEETLAPELPISENGEAKQLDDVLSNEEEVGVLTVHGGENGAAQPELQKDMVGNEDGAESAGEDDDDFARLCIEVAQSKK